jgi:hypothetical protein
VKGSKSRPKHAQAGVLYDTLQKLKSQEAAQQKADAAAKKAPAPAAKAPAAAAPTPAPKFTPAPEPGSAPAAAAAANTVGTQLAGTLGTDTANAGRRGGGGRRGRVKTLLSGFGGSGSETFGG